MQIDQVIALLYNLFGDEIRSTLGLTAVDLARIEAIHAFLVHRVDVRHLLLERLNINERHNDHSAGDFRRIQHRDDFLERDDRSVFRAVRTGDERQHRSRLRAMNYGDGNTEASVDTWWNFDRARNFLAACGGCVSDGESFVILR